MTYHLKNNYGLPLEREYEGWLASEIESYFDKIGVSCEVFAISPHIEKHFPSDINYFFRGKLIGLQLKRTLKDKGLTWKLTRAQQNKIVDGKLPIYYALPVFFNRVLKKNALHHFVFYNPVDKIIDKDSLEIKYVNELFADKVVYDKKMIDVCRWGKFAEMAMDCLVGEIIANSNVATLRDKKISEIINEPYNSFINKELQNNKNIFNLKDDISISSKEQFEHFKEYIATLKETNKARVDQNEPDEILLIISIKS